jgi:hypothetical protein
VAEIDSSNRPQPDFKPADRRKAATAQTRQAEAAQDSPSVRISILCDLESILQNYFGQKLNKIEELISINYYA